MKNKILDVIIGILGIAAAILFIIFKDNYQILLYCVSSLGALIGICLVLKKANYGYLVLSMCGSLLLSTIFYYNKVLGFNDCITFMVCSSVALVMFFTTIFDFLIKKAIKSKYSLNVVGYVIDLEKNRNVSKECYAPVYEYIVEGQCYEIVAPYYLDKNIPSIGDELDLRVDPKEPEQVYFNKSLKEEIKDKVVAIFLMVVCIIIIIGLF